MMGKHELLPCPFCGMSVTLDADDAGGVTTFKCPDTSPCIGSGLGTFALNKSRDQAIAAWNRRHPETAIPTDAVVNRAARAIYREAPYLGRGTEDGWDAQTEGYKQAAKDTALVVLRSALTKAKEEQR